MKAKGLQVGNLLQDIKFQQVVKINMVDNKNHMVCLEDGLCNLGLLEPIPLTEDWLLKFGFKKYDGWDDMIFWFKEKDENNMCRFALIETEQGYEIETTEKICKFVHELQNCYYFHELTGEELIINENL